MSYPQNQNEMIVLSKEQKTRFDMEWLSGDKITQVSQSRVKNTITFLSDTFWTYQISFDFADIEKLHMRSDFFVN